MKYKKKILVFGNFGYATNNLGGQTVRTRNVYSLLQKHQHEEISIDYFDADILDQNIWKIFLLVKKLMACDMLVYLPGQRNMLKMLPLIMRIQKVKRFEIIQIAIGGWLINFLKDRTNIKNYCASFRAILVQSKTLKTSLSSELDFSNVFYFPNYKTHSFFPTNSDSSKSGIFKLVFLARIVKEKGIDFIFDYAASIKNNKGFTSNIQIDFYGPIDATDKIYFEGEVMKYDFVDYKGILNPEEVHKTLSAYDLLILPTRHKGEGFPGSILDAYIAGIPVLVSDWLFLPEFVDHEKSGFVFEPDNLVQFSGYIEKLMNNPDLLKEIKRNALNKREEYSEDVAWDILKPLLVK